MDTMFAFRSPETEVTEATDQVLTDVLMALNDANRQELEQIDNNSVNMCRFRCTSGVVQNVMTMCHVLEVDDCVKYGAIELMDKLMVTLVCDTKRVYFETIQTLVRDGDHSGGPNAGQWLDWTAIEDKLHKQMHLRAITCVSIATKLLAPKNDGNSPPVTTTRLRNLLRECGYNYTLQNINRSELRVMKLLNYRLIHNPIDVYVHTLLEVLNNNMDHFGPYLEAFREIIPTFMDLYYICRQIITRNAYKVMAKRLSVSFNKCDEELEMERMSANKMLISCAIIASIPVLIDTRIYEPVIDELSHISGIDHNQIHDLSQAMLILIADV